MEKFCEDITNACGTRKPAYQKGKRVADDDEPKNLGFGGTYYVKKALEEKTGWERRRHRRIQSEKGLICS